MPDVDTRLDARLLKLLACPDTHQPLSLASGKVLERINAAIAAGSLAREGGEPLSRSIEAGLVTEDGRYFYPIEDGIPNLLVSDRVDLARVP